MNFYGGSRDYMVAVPNLLRSEMDYVTNEMNNVFTSLDHNSLLYNLQFLNVFVPLVAHTMVQKVVSGANLTCTETKVKDLLNFAQIVEIDDFGSDCGRFEPLSDLNLGLEKEFQLQSGFYVSDAPR